MSYSRNRADVPTRRSAALGAAATLAFAVSACQTAPDAPTVAAESPPPQPMAMPAMQGSAPEVYRVRSGSPAVLAKFPRGTVVSKDSKICLEAGQQITISGNNGQSVTYTGPGCAQRNARPSRENQGGFTFGWNGWVKPVEGLAAP